MISAKWDKKPMGIEITPQKILLPNLMKLGSNKYFANFSKEHAVN